METDLSYALLCFDGVELLLPRQDVLGVDTGAVIDPAPEIPGAAGRLVSGTPVFALDARLDLLSECPPGYRSCVAVGRNGGSAFALACEQAATIEAPGDATIEPLRECMRAPANPVEALLLLDDRLLLISSADALLRVLAPERAA